MDSKNPFSMIVFHKIGEPLGYCFMDNTLKNVSLILSIYKEQYVEETLFCVTCFKHCRFDFFEVYKLISFFKIFYSFERGFSFILHTNSMSTLLLLFHPLPTLVSPPPPTPIHSSVLVRDSMESQQYLA